MIAIDKQPNKEKSKIIETLEKHKEQKHQLENQQQQEENKVHIFSKRTQKQMERSIKKLTDISNEEEGWRFIRKNRRRRRRHVFQYRLFTNATKISALAICSLSIFLIVSFFSKSSAEAWEIPFLNVSVEWRDDKLEIKTVKRNDSFIDLKKTEEACELDLSEFGYEKMQEMLNKDYYYIEYQDKEKNKLTCMQFSLENPMYTQAIIEKYSKKKIDGVTYYYMELEKNNMIIWMDDKYQYQLVGAENINTLVDMGKIRSESK